MFLWRCVVESSTSGLGTDGADTRAVRIPVTVTRLPRLPKSANDNPPPRWLLAARVAFLLVLAGLALIWLRM